MREETTAKLVGFATGHPGEQIPAAALDAAAIAIADTLAVAVAGLAEPISAYTREWASCPSGSGDVNLWGTSWRAAIGEAALANGAASHALDFDDALPSMRGHPSAVLVPALLAVAQKVRSSGREVLEAYVIGVEALGALGGMVGNRHYDAGWHSTSTLGSLGVALAVARLMGLDDTRCRMALGIAASQASGLRMNFGTMTKPLHAGLAARAGVMAAWMASRGVTANGSALEGERGFLSLFGAERLDTGGLAESLDQLGSTWQVIDPGLSLKVWPCCLANYRPIAAFVQILAESGVPIEEIDEVGVGFLPGADSALVHRRPTTGLEAKFSVEYAIAAMALDGGISLKSFTDEQVSRPDARAFMNRVRRFSMPGERTYSGSGNDGYTDIELLSKNRVFRLRMNRVPGSSRWPVTGAMLQDKLEDCVDPILGPGVGSALMREATQLLLAPSIQPIVDLLTPVDVIGGHSLE